MKEKTFNRLKKFAKFLGTAAILGVAEGFGGSATISVGETPKKVYSYHEPTSAYRRFEDYQILSSQRDYNKRIDIDDISYAVEKLDGDYFKCNAAERIAKIVNESDNVELKYYAASKIANIADSMDSSYFQARVIDIATKLIGG